VENYTHSLIVERGKREKHKLNKARTRLYYQPVSTTERHFKVWSVFSKVTYFQIQTFF